MLVKELREALDKMPGEMAVYAKDGTGIYSAAHIFRMNLIGVEQFCEIITYTDNGHTPQMEDSLIERETGYANREELIEAHKKLQIEIAQLKEEFDVRS
uniref:Uncharacterized protein n=1 Tax=Ochrobactrum phage ORM_20 TaxID=2985243 RepID=A0A9N6WZT9_9VIRU|nr:hypothetical protein ORM20_00081 [Ochrobactrum phage ORM_20]